MERSASPEVIQHLRHARVQLLVLAGVTTMLALMLPPAKVRTRSVLSTVEPAYPELARLLGIDGVVRLAVTVDSVGRVIDVETLQGDPLLLDAAREAARRWRFSVGAGESRQTIDADAFSLKILSCLPKILMFGRRRRWLWRILRRVERE